MQSHESDAALEIRAAYVNQDWGRDLLLALHRAFGGAPGKHFVADLLKIDHMFPPGWFPIQRRERLNRTFQGGDVQVGDLVFSLESGERRMYQKTKRIIARRGSLPDEALRRRAPDVQTVRESAVDNDALRDLRERIEHLERQNMLSGPIGAAPAAPAAPATAATAALGVDVRMRRQTFWLSSRFERLIHVLRKDGNLDGYQDPPAPDFSDLPEDLK